MSKTKALFQISYLDALLWLGGTGILNLRVWIYQRAHRFKEYEVQPKYRNKSAGKHFFGCASLSNVNLFV